MKGAEVIVYPEIAAKALKIGEADLYVMWLLLRAMSARGDGRGIITVDDIKNTCEKVFGVTQKWAYSKINDGIGKYWRAPDGKKGSKTVGLMGQRLVHDHLKPEMTRSEPFVIPASLFKASEGLNFKKIKQLLIALIASRFVDNRPVTIDQIVEHTGLSESTIRNALKECALITKVANYEIVHKASTHIEAKAVQRALCVQSKKFRLAQQNGTWIVAKQMGNTYRVPETNRLPLRIRPKELKNFDKDNVSLYGKKRFYNNKSKSKHNGIYCVDHTYVSDQKAALWTTKVIESTKLPRSHAGKWCRLIKFSARGKNPLNTSVKTQNND